MGDFTGDDDLITGARAIVIGKVRLLACRLDAEQDRIFTYISVDVEETLKGEINARRIVLKEEGGEVDGQGSIIYGTPQFARGERVLLYLDTWGDGSLRVHQMSFGKLTIAEDSAGGEPWLIRADPGCEAMRAQAATRRHASAPAADQLRLNDYRRVIQTRLAVNRERAEAFEAATYAGVPCLSEPREYAGAISRGEMRPQFTLIYSVKSVRWFEPDSNQPVVFYINPDLAPNPQVIDDVGAAMIAWTNIHTLNAKMPRPCMSWMFCCRLSRNWTRCSSMCASFLERASRRAASGKKRCGTDVSSVVVGRASRLPATRTGETPVRPRQTGRLSHYVPGSAIPFTRR